METIKKIVGIVFILILVVGIGFAICYSPVELGMGAEYTTQISVETPDKIENAVSNAVADLEKRDFVPVGLTVRWHPARKTYVIRMGGMDRTSLGKREP
jgi:hypothetical protein